MKDRILLYGFLCAGVVIALICVTVIYHMNILSDTEVVFLDVGQGDAILISQGTNQILIDGGPDGTVLLEELGRHIPFWDRTIEVLVATHPDSDHIDGLISVFDNYHVAQLWHTHAQKDTATHKKLLHNAKEENGIEIIESFHGLKAMLRDASLEVVYPYNSDIGEVKDVNDTSIVTVFRVGNEAFYLGGDVTSEVEDALPLDRVTVLKASHHGSASSTSEQFLQKIHPRDVVISSGKDNRYGHPHDDVLTRVFRIGANVLRTDQEGSIVFKCKDNQECAQLY